MQKVLLITPWQRERLEAIMRENAHVRSSFFFKFDYKQFAHRFAGCVDISPRDAEHVYEDLYLNSEPEWKCYDLVTGSKILYDADGDFLYVI